jgi:hypothetical protein
MLRSTAEQLQRFQKVSSAFNNCLNVTHSAILLLICEVWVTLVGLQAMRFVAVAKQPQRLLARRPVSIVFTKTLF